MGVQGRSAGLIEGQLGAVEHLAVEDVAMAFRDASKPGLVVACFRALVLTPFLAAVIGALGPMPLIAAARAHRHRAEGRLKVPVCAAAWNKDPLSGVIGAEEGPLIPMV